MKSLIVFFLFIIAYPTVHSQSDKVQLIRNYTDSIDNILKNSDGLPGDVFCNTITMRSNKRAIGIQDTKISFFFMQRDDSVYEDVNGVQFIPRYNPPLKILVEYNVSAIPVIIAYYFDNTGMLVYYNNKYSSGEESSQNKCWFNSGIIQRIEKYTGESKNPVYEKSESFSSKDYGDAKKILFKSGLYVNMYYKIFDTEKIDK
jgi:hypothetical protein